MHVSGGDPGGERVRRRAVVLLALVALLAVVAIASTGDTPVGSGVARRPADALIDTLVSLVLVVVLAGSVAIFYVYYLQRTGAHEERRRGGTVTPRSLLATIAFVLFVLALAVRVALDNRNHNGTGAGTGGRSLDGGSLVDRARGYEPRFATVPVIVILGIAGIAGIATFLAHRARLRELEPLEREPSLGLALAEVLGETLDDLRAEPDPRRAVVAAYARLERTLAAYGVPRRPSEAPEEYLRRVLVDLEVGALSARRLTELFAEAKFSHHPVGPDMKEEAIELLESTRADLLAAEAARTAAALPDGAVAEGERT